MLFLRPCWSASMVRCNGGQICFGNQQNKIPCLVPVLHKFCTVRGGADFALYFFIILNERLPFNLSFLKPFNAPQHYYIALFLLLYFPIPVIWLRFWLVSSLSASSIQHFLETTRGKKTEDCVFFPLVSFLPPVIFDQWFNLAYTLLLCMLYSHFH